MRREGERPKRLAVASPTNANYRILLTHTRKLDGMRVVYRATPAELAWRHSKPTDLLVKDLIRPRMGKLSLRLAYDSFHAKARRWQRRKEEDAVRNLVFASSLCLCHLCVFA